LNFRYFGGIKLGTGGLVRAYGGVASECLKNAPTCLVKTKVVNFLACNGSLVLSIDSIPRVSLE
jgi:putative IMPACT (imprinted ancient) family translation regulator